MKALGKVLVVDTGDRAQVDVLSVELAGLGLSSVTASVEAAPGVLAVIARPAAIFLKVPRARHGSDYDRLVALAAEWRDAETTRGIPVIMWDSAAMPMPGSVSAMLRAEIEDPFGGSPDP